MSLKSIVWAGLTALASSAQFVSAADAKPNVILIMADDLGYECIGANGGTSYKTPVLDKLAAGGVRFDHCYVQPLCTPTRAQLMTGIYNVRNYIEFGYLDPRAVTFGNMFQKAGYATCITGKWQLGQAPELPRTFGFDEHCLWQHTRRPGRYKNPGLEINGVEQDYTQGEYGPDIVNDYALDFIQRKKDTPFFLYYPMMLTHAPYDATPDSTDYDGGKPRAAARAQPKNGINTHFADMVAYMDKLIGKLVARLDQLGLRENTLILFVGDNGTGAGTRSMMGDRLVIGRKGSTIDAGMHVPAIASWPGKAAQGRVCHDLIDSTDFLPTICAAAGITVPAELKIDGRSFFPQVRGETGQPREWIYSWYGPQGPLKFELAFNQRYKLYTDGNFYDLSQDLEETRPIEVNSLKGEAAAAAKLLQSALDRFKAARPANIAKPGAKKVAKKAIGKQ